MINLPVAYERIVGLQLKQQGFYDIQFTPKTGDYGTDILCKDKYGCSCAVQCKLYSKPVGYKAVQETFSGAKFYNCQRAILISSNKYTKSAITGAKRLGVELFTFKI